MALAAVMAFCRPPWPAAESSTCRFVSPAYFAWVLHTSFAVTEIDTYLSLSSCLYAVWGLFLDHWSVRTGTHDTTGWTGGSNLLFTPHGIVWPDDTGPDCTQKCTPRPPHWGGRRASLPGGNRSVSVRLRLAALCAIDVFENKWLAVQGHYVLHKVSPCESITEHAFPC